MKWPRFCGLRAAGLALVVLAVAAQLNFALRDKEYLSWLNLFGHLGLAVVGVWVRLSRITEHNSKGTVYDAGGTC